MTHRILIGDDREASPIASGWAPAMASSIAALSRTERVSTCSWAKPRQTSPMSGPVGVRPRVGLSPNTPQQEAGMRIDPPPSLACAMGTKPAATAAAEPPDDPPVVRPLSQGLRAGPKRRGSVVGRMPNSGVLVLPSTMSPARFRRTTSSLSSAET